MSEPVKKRHLKTMSMVLLAMFGTVFLFINSDSVLAQEQKPTAKSEKKQKKESETKESEELFLPEAKVNQEFMPEIYRCPECGYEQDEPGTCPDHNDMELVKVLSKGRNPLEPPEFDGNEDLLVDIPLKNLEFRKENILKTATETEDIKDNKN